MLSHLLSILYYVKEIHVYFSVLLCFFILFFSTSSAIEETKRLTNNKVAKHKKKSIESVTLRTYINVLPTRTAVPNSELYVKKEVPALL